MTVVTSEWDSVLDKVEWLRGRPRTVERLSGGLTNVNLKVTSGDQCVVVRVAQEGSELLAIDRVAEHENSVAAAQSGVGAPVVDYVSDAGLLIVGYIDGVTLTEDDVRRGDRLARIADACRTLHAGPRFVNEFDMFTIQRGYLELASRNGFRIPDRYLDFLPQVERMRQAFARLPIRTVPCNNDLLAGNFIDDGSKIWLIDYEYSGNNDASFELGNTATECGLDEDQVDALVASYFGSPLRHELARVRLQALVSAYGWSLWGAIQACASPLDADYDGWGRERFEKAARGFTSQRFPTLLEEAAGAD